MFILASPFVFTIAELTAWQNTTACSVTCDEGTYNRTRQCLDPNQANIEVDPEQCGVGTTTLETLPCHMPPCAGKLLFSIKGLSWHTWNEIKLEVAELPHYHCHALGSSGYSKDSK